MFLIKGFCDRILFALGLLVFMQAPQFVDQYTQRLGGYLQAQKQHLAQYQSIADEQFAGDLDALLHNFQSNDNPSVNQTAATIEQTRQQVTSLEVDLSRLEDKNFVYKLGHILTHIHLDVAQATLRIFTPGIPLTLESLLCGLLGGVLFSALFAFLLRLFRFVKKTEKESPKPRMGRIEPSIKRVDSI